MNRNLIDQENECVQVKEPGNLKKIIEKGLILGSFIIIATALLLFPKLESYASNRQLLVEKLNCSNNGSSEIPEERYLEEIQKIKQRVENTKKSIPDSIDTGKLYEGMMEIARKTNVDLSSVRFGSMTIASEADENNSSENISNLEEKMILEADGRILVRCQISATCFGSQEDCTSFLKQINEYQPLIKIISCDLISEASNKIKMSLVMESYGLIKKEEVDNSINKDEVIN